jgi:hypothetical protein
MTDGTQSYFRKRRGRILAGRIADLSRSLGRPIRIVDVGGRSDYWENVGVENIASITVLNIESSDLGRPNTHQQMFSELIGDARALGDIPDGAFDFYHSNSVIEHVGSWSDMVAMAREARRVAPHGWVQTPAWGFPVEPHFRLPFIHWFATPVRASLLRFARSYGTQSRHARRLHAERINLLTRSEVGILFPDCTILVERFLLFPKSCVAVW